MDEIVNYINTLEQRKRVADEYFEHTGKRDYLIEADMLTDIIAELKQIVKRQNNDHKN